MQLVLFIYYHLLTIYQLIPIYGTSVTAVINLS